MSNKDILIVIGPTAVGKTAVACHIKDIITAHSDTFAGAMLISADSAMVYKGLDIGSAKPTLSELERWPHELINLRNPEEIYTAADFVHDADECVRRAWQDNLLPVIVGGTMLYVKRFVEGIADMPDADTQLRTQLEARYLSEGPQALHNELAQLDPQAAEKIHPNNKQRLLRALEVIELSSEQFSQNWASQTAAVDRLGANLHQFGIVPDNRQLLHQRIEQRFELMLQEGFLQEAQRLFAGLNEDETTNLPAMRSVGYRQAGMLMRGECDDGEFKTMAVAATRQLAKRQLTWMRNWPDLQLVNWGEALEIAQNIVKQLR